MRFILSVIFIIITSYSYGQNITWFDINKDKPGFPENRMVKNIYDTAVLYKGNVTCSHEWAFKQRVFKMTSCAVFHGPAGCPDEWLNEFRICKKCLRHENITEIRIVETKEDEYESLASKLKI
jgi:hypothetical protein